MYLTMSGLDYSAASIALREQLSFTKSGVVEMDRTIAGDPALLGVVLATDFSNAFVTFHHIFFDNDLWILDPRVDMLVNIVPEGFFFDTAARILGLFLGALVLLCGLSLWYLGRSPRRSGRRENKA